MLVCLPAGASGGTLPDYGGLSFQSGGINPEPYFCKGLKAPVTVFLVAGILPTVPGASVYRCVYFMIQGLADLSTYHLVQTIQIAGAMALAIFIVDSLFRLVQKT